MLTLILATAMAATLPPGEPVERAAALHVTNSGFANLGDAVEGLIPSSFPVANIAGDFECDESDAQPMSYALSNIDLRLAAEDVAIVASEGRLDIVLYLSLSSTPAQLVVQGDCSFLTDLDEVCDVEFPTTSLVATLGMEMALGTDAEGNVVVDVVAEDPRIEISPIGNPLGNCTLANAIGTLLGQNPAAISDLLLSFVNPELEGLGEELEVTIEDALSALVIETSFALGEGEVALELYPTTLDLGDHGLVLGLGASSVPSLISDCVDAGEGSEFADAPWPAFAETAWDTSLQYDAGIFLNRDFVDNVLWGVWASGALCLNLSEIDAVPTLDTALFTNLFGESFGSLFDPDNPSELALSTDPVLPPRIGWHEDGPPMSLQLRGFGLDFAGPLDDRQIRLFQVGVEADVGIDPGLSATRLEPALIINEDDIVFTEPYNELVESGFSAGLADFLPTVLGGLLPDDLLPAMDIPSVMGIGLETVFWLPDTEDQWMGGFILLATDDVEPLEIAGCDGGSFGCDGFEGEQDPFDFEAILGCGDSGGCGDEATGCEGGTGCTTPLRIRIPGWRLVLLGALVPLVLRRRRR